MHYVHDASTALPAAHLVAAGGNASPPGVGEIPSSRHGVPPSHLELDDVAKGGDVVQEAWRIPSTSMKNWSNVLGCARAWELA